jgi:hypothetical protein
MFIFFEIKIIYLFAAQKVRHLYCLRRTLSETESLTIIKVIVAKNRQLQHLNFNTESDMLKLG